MRVVHVISGLRMGGAEAMVARLVDGLDGEEFASGVVSLTTLGIVGQRMRERGIDVREIGFGSPVRAPAALLRLVRILRERPVDVVQTWLYHADLIGGLAARLATRAAVLWNIRHSDFAPESRRRPAVVSAGARLSRWLPDRIISCSAAAARLHAEMGYAADRMVVIPNGFDLGRFRPDPRARAALRAEVGLPEDAPVVGIVGRHHPQKDHRTFFRAASLVRRVRPDVRFLLCGPLLERGNAELGAELAEANVGDRCVLLGRRTDVERIDAALDVACSSSAWGEGFSNVIGEAMACEVPCVVTDVGDASEIVGETGRIVPRRDPQAMAAAILGILDMPADERRKLGAAARARIAGRYSLESVVRRYAELYRGFRRDPSLQPTAAVPSPSLPH
jgi:glycosyltransferase involved in cell wall biosynthesis